MKSPAFAPIAVVTAVVVAGLAAYALLRRPSAPEREPVSVLIGLDGSDSVRAHKAEEMPLLGASVNLAAQLGETLDPERDALTVFRVDSQTREFYDDKAPYDPEAFHSTLIRYMKPEAQRGGTYPAKFWAEAARRAQGSSRSVAVVYAGDADNDDLRAEAMETMRRAGVVLAKNPRVVTVYICGANPKNWEKLRRVFAPLGERLHLQAPSEMNIAPLLADLENLRPASPSERLATG